MCYLCLRVPNFTPFHFMTQLFSSYSPRCDRYIELPPGYVCNGIISVKLDYSGVILLLFNELLYIL